MKASSYTNRHIHLCLFKLGYDVHALLSSVMYILSGAAVYTMSRRRWDQNTTQVDNRLNRARATYVRLLHLPPWFFATLLKDMERGGSYTYSTKILPAKPLTLETYYKKQSARKLAYLCVIFYQVYSPNVSGLRYWRSRICFWTHLVRLQKGIIQI